MSVQKQMKKLPKLKAATSQKLLNACEVNDLRKSYNKLWVDVKEETLPIVEAFGGFTVGKIKNKEYSLEIIKKMLLGLMLNLLRKNIRKSIINF